VHLAEHRAQMEVAFRAVAGVVRGDDLADAPKRLAFVRREQGDFDGAAAALELSRAHTSQPAPSAYAQ
jgi:hypothetical protein